MAKILSVYLLALLALNVQALQTGKQGERKYQILNKIKIWLNILQSHTWTTQISKAKAFRADNNMAELCVNPSQSSIRVKLAWILKWNSNILFHNFLIPRVNPAFKDNKASRIVGLCGNQNHSKHMEYKDFIMVVNLAWIHRQNFYFSKFTLNFRAKVDSMANKASIAELCVNPSTFPPKEHNLAWTHKS